MSRQARLLAIARAVLAVPEADIMMTWNRDTYPQDDVGAVSQELRGPRHREYKNFLQELFAQYDFDVLPKDSVGYWEGAIEPATITTVDYDNSEELRLLEGLAAAAGGFYNQDAVLIFTLDGGPDCKYQFSSLSTGEIATVREAMGQFGLSGATFQVETGGRLVLYGKRRPWVEDSTSDITKIEDMIDYLMKVGVEFSVVRQQGTFRLIEGPEYEARSPL